MGKILRYNGGTSNADSLHQTLNDALLLVKGPGERYLWIDYICIHQGSDLIKMAEVQRMDLIYSNAYATIIAASGIDSNAGLPGVRLGTCQTVPVVEIFGKPLVILVRDLPPLR